MKTFISKYVSLFLLLLLLSSSSISAQNVEKLLKTANGLFNNHAYEQAIELYRDVLLVDNSLEAKKKLAESYRLLNDHSNAEYWYEKLMGLEPAESSHKLHYARALQSNGKTDKARKWFAEYGKTNKLGLTLAKGCDMTKQLSKDKDKYDLLLLPINSPASDFGAMPNGNGILFCSNRAELGRSSSSIRTNRTTFMDIYHAEKQLGNQFTPPKKLKGQVNSKFNDGPITISEDGKQMLFTRNHFYKGKKRKSAEGTMKLAIFTASLEGDKKWTKVQEFQHNNREFSLAHPTLSKNGQNLFFVSDMMGGFGGYDIFMVTKIDTFWSAPVNLGPAINTAGNEVFPYVHEDGTLYFSSDGHPGLGGLDLFSTERIGNKWRDPKNLGKPFNSLKDDFSLVFNKTKELGYFSSNRDGGFGRDDIYSFTKKGSKIYNSNNTVIELAQPPLAQSTLNQSLKMNKIHFPPGNWNLLPETARELDKLAIYMRSTPEVTVELAAHTDSRGDDYANREISLERANVAKQYLTQNKGIAEHRLVAKGYGEQQIKNHCFNGMECSEEMHDVNNRLEAKVLSISSIVGQSQMPPAPQPVSNPKPPTNTFNDENLFQSLNNFKNSSDGGTFHPLDNTPSSPSTKKQANPTPNLTPPPGVQPLNSEQIKKKNRVKGKIITNSNKFLGELTYKIFIGPFKNVDNDLFYTYKELNTPIDIEYTSKGMMIVLGPYDTIEKAEQMETYAKEKSEKKNKRKTRVVVFKGTEQTNLKLRKLKRMK